MDTVEIPSHFMENFVYDASTLQLFMKGQKDVNKAGKHAQALAQQVKEDRHLLGALDLELQVRPAAHFFKHCWKLYADAAWFCHMEHPSKVLFDTCMLCVMPHGPCLEVVKVV